MNRRNLNGTYLQFWREIHNFEIVGEQRMRNFVLLEE